jgi:hypothetical protein
LEGGQSCPPHKTKLTHCLRITFRTEGDVPRRLLALVTAQNLLYRALQVVVAQHPKLCEGPDYAQELLKRPTGLLWFRRMLCIIRPRSEGI